MRVYRLKLTVVAALLCALAACTGADSTLGITPQNTPLPDQTPSTPATPIGNNVYFAPIVGAPVDQVTALSRQLSQSGPALGITLSAQQAPGLTHEIRGYFSALSEGSTTTVIHVWDVFTPQGERVHRIQGQEIINTAAPNDPWSVVPPTTMETIADRVLADYQTWRATLS